MIWAARVPVLLAALTTMWFNGSFMWSRADALPQQLGLTAMALAVDLAKCTFLPAAAQAFRGRYRLRAIIFVLLWLPALTFSTYCGYSAIFTNRHTISQVADGKAQDHDRLIARYERALADLAAAKKSPAWTATGACIAPTPKTRDACKAIQSLQASVDALAHELGPTPTVAADPELATLGKLFPAAGSWLPFLVSAFPALLLELVASLGSYAAAPLPKTSTPPHTPEKPAGAFLWTRMDWLSRKAKNPPATVPGALPHAPAVSVARAPTLPKPVKLPTVQSGS